MIFKLFINLKCIRNMNNINTNENYLRQQELQEQRFLQQPFEDIVEGVTEPSAEEPYLATTPYSDKSFIVYGTGVGNMGTYLTNLGGSRNERLGARPPHFAGKPKVAYIFSNGKKQVVDEFLQRVNSGSLNNPVQTTTGGISLPFSIAPVKAESKYQYVKWSVFKPQVGMTASIKAGGGSIEGSVISTEIHKDVISTVYVRTTSGDSKLVICNAEWQVWGYDVPHKVFFKDVTNPSTPSPPNAFQQMSQQQFNSYQPQQQQDFNQQQF
jgi:hypothetical protein